MQGVGVSGVATRLVRWQERKEAAAKASLAPSFSPAPSEQEGNNGVDSARQPNGFFVCSVPAQRDRPRANAAYGRSTSGAHVLSTKRLRENVVKAGVNVGKRHPAIS